MYDKIKDEIYLLNYFKLIEEGLIFIELFLHFSKEAPQNSQLWI